MHLPSGIRDNRARGSAGHFLRAKVTPGSRLSVVTAYFTIFAHARLRAELDRLDRLRLLFGEPCFVGRHDPERDESKAFLLSAHGLSLGNRLRLKRAARDCADWIARKVDIRTVRQSGFLHGKLFHVARGSENDDDGASADALLGSSNFTVPGLGLSDHPARNNIELNLVVNDDRDRRDLLDWFNEFWRDEKLTTDVKAEVLGYLKNAYADQSPEFIYYKTLFHLFEHFLRDLENGGLLDEKLRLTDTEVWKNLFLFQQDGARAAINKLLQHRGCILADSVGLGKTWEALAVIKYFELRNENVLVLCPKKLEGNWELYPAYNHHALNPFPGDRYNFTLRSHTDLGGGRDGQGPARLANFQWGNFGLVVIDESHNFRNRSENPPGEPKTRYQKLLEDVIGSGVDNLTVTTRDRLNPLRPYWLAYVHATGDVRYTYAQPRLILEVFRTLCSGQSTANADLCALFDQQTRQGEDVNAYDRLLDQAVASFNPDRPGAPARFSTLLDLYALPAAVPGLRAATTAADVTTIEAAIAARLGEPRFSPYLQRHEFEALLLAHPPALTHIFPEAAPALAALEAEVAGQPPEDLNHGRDTHPAARLLKAIPDYYALKASNACWVAVEVTLDRMRVRCPRFHAWLERWEAWGMGTPPPQVISP